MYRHPTRWQGAKTERGTRSAERGVKAAENEEKERLGKIPITPGGVRAQVNPQCNPRTNGVNDVPLSFFALEGRETPSDNENRVVSLCRRSCRFSTALATDSRAASTGACPRSVFVYQF